MFKMKSAFRRATFGPGRHVKQNMARHTRPAEQSDRHLNVFEVIGTIADVVAALATVAALILALAQAPAPPSPPTNVYNITIGDDATIEPPSHATCP
jgi:hypothetical protein